MALRHAVLPVIRPVGRFADQKEKSMTRADAIAQARQQLHSGEFLAELDRRVAYRTESQNIVKIHRRPPC
jgi:hypothetical protein